MRVTDSSPCITAFQDPTKFIGPMYSQEEADRRVSSDVHAGITVSHACLQ